MTDVDLTGPEQKTETIPETVKETIVQGEGAFSIDRNFKGTVPKDKIWNIIVICQVTESDKEQV